MKLNSEFFIPILISVINVELCIAKDSAPKVIGRESVLLRVSAGLIANVKFYYRLLCEMVSVLILNI